MYHKKFVLKTGWQEHGIELYNRLYQDVKADRNEFGEEFDDEFQTFYTARTQEFNSIFLFQNK